MKLLKTETFSKKYNPKEEATFEEWLDWVKKAFKDRDVRVRIINRENGTEEGFYIKKKK